MPMRRSVLWTAFVLYIGLLIRFLVLKYVPRALDPRPYTQALFDRVARGNYVPFVTIDRYVNGYPNSGVAALNILGNVLAFLPLGILLPLLYPSLRSLWKITLLGLLVSLLIECTQLVFVIGVFDVDDLLLNTLGAVLGYVCLRVAARFRRARKPA